MAKQSVSVLLRVDAPKHTSALGQAATREIMRQICYPAWLTSRPLFTFMPASLAKLPVCITALVTPFTAQQTLDEDKLRRLIERQTQAGIQALVLGGSTGEGQMLTASEREILLRTGKQSMAANEGIILAGTGGFSTQQTIEQTQQAKAHGADAALVVAPPYVRPTQEGLYRHFMRVADEGGLPVMLYNVPSRTSCNILPETIERLAAHPQIFGIKDAYTQDNRLTELRSIQATGHLSHDFLIYSGDDPSAAAWLQDGADGLVSVASNVAPGMMHAYCQAAKHGRSDELAGLESSLHVLFDLLCAEPNPIPVKGWLALAGIIEPHLREPLTDFSDMPALRAFHQAHSYH